MLGDDRIQETETLLGRIDVLERLCRSPAYIRDLVDETGQSRSTINRAINELEAIELVERGDEGVEPTAAGRLARDRLVSFLGEFDDILTARDVLDPISPATGIDPEVLAGCETVLATDPAPYRPLERIYDELTGAARYRALVPTLGDTRHVRLLYEHVVTGGNPAELVVTPEVYEMLRQEFPRRMAVMAEEDAFSVFVGSVPAFGLGLFESDTGSGKPPRSTANVVVYNESGGVHGIVLNDAEPAIQWSEDLYADARDGATDRTEELLDEPVGSAPGADVDGGLANVGQSLAPSLEREGFVRVDVSYFRDEPVDDPATAWRAGLSIAEVHTGYAIPLRGQAGQGDHASQGPLSPDDDDLASSISSELMAGGDSVVVGPPGSGKSTVCKAVACEWYAADRGPVLYRESNRGRSIASVDDLVATLSTTDGHALVVVEDATRPDANRIFEAIERLGDREDVSFLLDAREREWREHSSSNTTVLALEVLYVPPLREADCERLVEHFERTAGRRVDVSAERLWSTVREETAVGDDGPAPNEMLRLIHRLAAYADPLADDPTALEEAVAAVHDAVADDEVALSVCILANTLNAGGIGVDRKLLYAVTDDGRFAAVDDAIERLEGHVLFPRDDGTDRTVHEEWSTTFLAHLVEADEEAAPRRFGTAVSALLALADDHEHCEQIASHLGDSWDVPDVVDEPGSWADDVVESVYDLGRTQSKLAPLFTDDERDTIDLPEACSDSVVDQQPIWLGKMFLAGGYYDRAERAFERLPSADPDRGSERLLGLARVSSNRGAYDDAIDYCRECLSLVDTEDRATIRARARVRLADAMIERGEFSDAESHYETALNEFRAGGLRGWEARTRQRIGRVSMERGEYDRAHEYYESSLQIRRELGDRRGEAETLNSMGTIAWHQGAYDRASELFERRLEISKAIGDRPGVASSLNNLGAIEMQRGNYDRAAELYERSLELRRNLGDRQSVAKCLHNLGVLQRRRGNYDRAAEFYERSLEIKEEIGDRVRMAGTLNNLGTLEGLRGNYDRALEWFERSLELRRELDDRPGVSESLHNLGTFESMRGNFDRGSTLYKQSLEIKEDLGDRPSIADLHADLGTIARERGAFDRALEHCERALEIASEIDASLVVSKSHLGLGGLALEKGEHERARDHLELATDAVQAGHPVSLEIRLSRGKLALARGDLDRARSIVTDVIDEFEEMDMTHWSARCRRVLGRIAVEADEDELAREHLLDATETFEEMGALHDALTTLSELVETYSEETEDVARWQERARDLASEASDEIVERHQGWIEDAPS